MTTQLPTIAGWDEFVDALRDLPSRVLPRVSERMRSDPQIVAEIGRRLVAAVAYSTLDTIGRDPDYPVFLPLTGQVINFGQPNADTLYRSARIAGDGTYRLRGEKGKLRIAVIAQLDPFPGEPGGENLDMPGATRAHNDINALNETEDGQFDVILSPNRPKGYTGDWWKLEPTVNKLMLRWVKGDWVGDLDGVLTIERLDTPAARPRRSAADLEALLRELPGQLNYYGGVLIDHVEGLRQQGFVNKLTCYEAGSDWIGLENQFYFEGAYDVADDEALIVEARIPENCEYYSVIMTNEIFETTDWYNNHSALNDSQAKPDADGVLRFVIATKDPGVPNWLDTAGYRQGEFQGRWYGKGKPTIPTMTKVRYSEIRNHLPPETGFVSAEERESIIRDRRNLLQRRPLW